MVTVLHEGPPVITDRQLQVIELIAAGCSNDEVAQRLGIRVQTAEAPPFPQGLGAGRPSPGD